MTDPAPYARLLQLATDGEELVMPFHDDVVGRPTYLHGGAIAGLLEFAAYSALERALAGAPATIKPITVTVDYLRRGRSLETRAVAVIERLGNRIANVEATAWQDDRAKPIAAARINFLLERA